MSKTPLQPDYHVEVDRITRKEWGEIINHFNDATIYQTWSYGLIRWSERNISHISVKMHDKIIAVAQLRIMSLPLLKIGIAYLPEGPLWQHRDHGADNKYLFAITNALIEEYVKKRGLFLRIIPSVIDDEKSTFRTLLEDTGLRWQASVPGYRTFLMDLSPPTQEIRKKFKGNWRGHLNKAEKNGLQVEEGTSDELYVIFLQLYKEMHQRKQFKELVDVDEFRTIQNDLPNHQKLRIFVCKHLNKPVSAIVVSALGNKGIYLLGATGSDGMKLKSAYLTQWKAIEWLKDNGYEWYDLGGIDPEENKGTYDFKAGLTGKAGEDVSQVGQFDMAPNLISKIMIRLADKIRHITQ